MRRFDRFPTTDPEASEPQLALDETGDSDDEAASGPERHGSLRRKLAKLARPIDSVLATIDGGGEGSSDGPDNRPATASELQARLRTLAPKHDLDRRFGHPALTAALWTPMIFARHERLLAQVYESRPIKQIEVGRSAASTAKEETLTATLPFCSSGRSLGARQPTPARGSGRRHRNRARQGGRACACRRGGCRRAGACHGFKPGARRGSGLTVYVAVGVTPAPLNIVMSLPDDDAAMEGHKRTTAIRGPRSSLQRDLCDF